jgi:hypothetical protein
MPKLSNIVDKLFELVTHRFFIALNLGLLGEDKFDLRVHILVHTY